MVLQDHFYNFYTPIRSLPEQILINPSFLSRRCEMRKQINFLVSLAIVLIIPACGSKPNLSGPSEPQPTETQAVPVEEEQTQPTLLQATDTPLNPQSPIFTIQVTDTPLDPQSPYSAIQATLRSYPPCAGNKEMRNAAILDLDAYLKDDSLNWRADMVDFYSNMIGFVEYEITEPVASGVRIWSMYNHGFIIKTPSTIFAFDLVHGYAPWDYQIPDSILEQVQVLFISHRHADHNDMGIIRAITAFGGKVVMPAEDSRANKELVGLSADEETTLAGLQIKAYDGLHADIPVRMFVVTTPEGLTIMHTGDNQTSETLPEGLAVDILLLNAWVNESGSASPIIGMHNSIKKLSPELTILGHIQELSHFYAPSDVKSRLSFEAPLAADNGLLPGYLSVQVWGEQCNFPLK
jgi:L-ascorbate metabolism protein UlaG (beta-lactamase superfamily)